MPPPRPREHDSATATRLTRAGTAVMVSDQTVDMPAHFRVEWADPSVNLCAYT
jgi:hypothetical protein